MKSYKISQQFWVHTSIRSRYNWNTENKQNTALNEELIITELALVANVGHSLEMETSNRGRSLGGLTTCTSTTWALLGGLELTWPENVAGNPGIHSFYGRCANK